MNISPQPRDRSVNVSRARLNWVDYAKGLAILLVVYRHALVGLNRAGLFVPEFLYNMQEYVYNFRMPVFFVLSGIFLGKTLNKNTTGKIAKKKVATLFYPYLLWTVVLISMQILFSAYTNSSRTVVDYSYILLQPRNLDHMWYLLALFNTSILYLAARRWWNPGPLVHVIFAVVLFHLTLLVRDYSFFSDLFYHYIFLLAGVLLSERTLSDRELSLSQLALRMLMVLPFFVVGQWGWQQLDQDNMYLQPLLLIIVLIACVFFYYFCRFFYQAGIFKGLIYVGKHSLPVYILHLFVISFIRIVLIKVFMLENIYLIIFLSMLLGITLPIIFYRICRKLGIGYLFEWGKINAK